MAIHPTTSADEYHAWYDTARGRWIGEMEFRLMMRILAPRAGSSLLDVGSGTGYFTHCFADAGPAVTGLDRDAAMVRFARERTSVTGLRVANRGKPFSIIGAAVGSRVGPVCMCRVVY